MFTFASRLLKFDSNLWQYHFIVPDDIAQKLIKEDNKRVFCTVNQMTRWPAALMKSKEYWFILINTETRKLLKVDEGNSLDIKLEEDFSEYGFEMPEEFGELLAQDEEAKRHFMSLTVGKRRSLIYLVQKVKSTDSRLRKSLAIVHHLKDVNGKLDFKLLNETIKAFNKKSI